MAAGLRRARTTTQPSWLNALGLTCRGRLPKTSNDGAPPAFGIEPALHRLRLGFVTLEAAVLQLDPRRNRTFGNEANLYLGTELGVVLPVRADIPRQHDSVRRLPHQ